MDNELNEFEKSIQRIREASPLELPYAIMETELHDKQSACEFYHEVSKSFEGEGIVKEVLTPVMSTMIDGILSLKCFKGLSRKMGLSSQRVIEECESFNYEGRLSFLMPDAFVEYKNNAEVQELWGKENRSKYIRSTYEDTNSMNKYKKQKIKENGTRVNMEDEYRQTKDITGSKKSADKRRNDPKNEHNAETDHIIPLHETFNQLQNNSALSPGDIRRIANQDYNFAVTGRLINNPKRDMSNSEFIKEQDRLKKEGKPYVELSESQRKNMLRMEKEAQEAINQSVNNTVLMNLQGKGRADRKERKAAMDAKQEELGRKLTKEERASVDKELAKKKALDIHKNNAADAGKQSLMYLAGNILLLFMKPMYYEVKDMIMNGFIKGVTANSFKQALSIRFSRIKNYIWSYIKNIKNLLGSAAIDFIKDFISAFIEGIIGMFVGVFKKILRVLKEGVKIGIQSYNILFGENSKEMNANQKGDALIKLLSGSVVALCGIGINELLGKIPGLDEQVKEVISTLCSGLASILLFYALDKADLFNVKKERREKRLDEVFEMRIQEIRERTSTFEDAAIERLRSTYLQSRIMLNDMRIAAENEDYGKLNFILSKYHDFLIPNKNNETFNWDC